MGECAQQSRVLNNVVHFYVPLRESMHIYVHSPDGMVYPSCLGLLSKLAPPLASLAYWTASPCCILRQSQLVRSILIKMTVILLQRNHKIEYYGEELSERFKAGQKRSTVAAVKYKQIDMNY
jgi:hypothetical protein